MVCVPVPDVPVVPGVVDDVGAEDGEEDVPFDGVDVDVDGDEPADLRAEALDRGIDLTQHVERAELRQFRDELRRVLRLQRILVLELRDQQLQEGVLPHPLGGAC